MTMSVDLLKGLRRCVLALGVASIFLLNGIALAETAASSANEIASAREASSTADQSPRPIQFKQESKHSNADEVKPFIVLAVMTVLAVFAVYWLKKRQPALLARLGSAGGRIKVVETRMVSARLSLSLIEVDGKKLLLAVNGDNVVQLHIDLPSVCSIEYPTEGAGCIE